MMNGKSSKPLLELKEIRAVYGKKICALKGVSLKVHEGEVVALIGNNGAGKTTLLKTISGLLPLESGEILYQESRINGLPPHTIASLGIAHVPEGRKIFPHLTILENLEMGAYLRKGRIQEDLEHVYHLFPILKSRASQLGGTLSGGEQQMLAMGRALMARPKLLMLDEPSMGLAPVVVDRIFEIIARISAEGTTVFLVEQNARRALKAAVRGYVLETGNIILSDATSNLAENPELQKAYLGVC